MTSQSDPAAAAPIPKRSLSQRPPVRMAGAWWKAAVVVGLLGGVLVSTVAGLATKSAALPVRPVRELDAETLAQATEAYRDGRWDEARRGFETLLRAEPGHARARDYLDRLNAIAEESDKLELAEEAVVAGRLAMAERLGAAVPPHSPLFAQAEALLRAPPGGDEVGVPAPGRGAEAAGVNVSGVLQQAVALYHEGRFEEAAARARELADGADGAARRELHEWAVRCAMLGELKAVLPAGGSLGGSWLPRATQALDLDRQLGGAHSRELRPRVVAAYRGLIEGAWNGGDVAAACGYWVEGQRWEPRDTQWSRWPGRCARMAEEQFARGLELAPSQPNRAREIYANVLRMVPQESHTHRRAQARLRALTRTR